MYSCVILPHYGVRITACTARSARVGLINGSHGYGQKKAYVPRQQQWPSSLLSVHLLSVDDLGHEQSPDTAIYWSFANCEPLQQLVANARAQLPGSAAITLLISVPSDCPVVLPPITAPTIRTVQEVHVRQFLALWFTHLKMLRAQNGLAPEGSGVVGMDEVRCLHAAGLVELRLHMAAAVGLGRLTRMADAAVAEMAKRPQKYLPMLLGLS